MAKSGFWLEPADGPGLNSAALGRIRAIEVHEDGIRSAWGRRFGG